MSWRLWGLWLSFRRFSILLKAKSSRLCCSMHQSANNSKKQEFQSCSSLHGPNLIANLLPVPNPECLSLCSIFAFLWSKTTSWCWQVSSHASWWNSQERLAHRKEPIWAAPGQVSQVCTFHQMASSLQSLPQHPLSPIALCGGTPARQDSYKFFCYALWHLLSSKSLLNNIIHTYPHWSVFEGPGFPAVHPVSISIQFRWETEG